MTEEQKKQLEDIIENQKIYIYEDVVRMMGLPRPEVRAQLKKMHPYRLHFVKCPHCGREIIVTDTNRQQKFCNPDHRKLYYNRHRNKPKISVCARCGKEFAQYSFRNSKYCSIECAARDREEAKRKKAEKK